MSADNTLRWSYLKDAIYDNARSSRTSADRGSNRASFIQLVRVFLPLMICTSRCLGRAHACGGEQAQ